MEFPRPLISVERLAAILDRDDVVVADCRFALDDTEAGRRAYKETHIPGAVYFHLDEDLSSPIREHGGRHPLPDPGTLAEKLGKAGIGPGVKVIAYDNAGAFAARLWWLLRWLGHDEVAVLDGGYAAWQAAGLPVTAEVPAPLPRAFRPEIRPEMVVGMEEVRDRARDQVLVDARAPERYAGEVEPLDPVAGHIPGAVNRPWEDSLRPDGRWRSPKEQARRFADLPHPEKQIHYCGSGVTACANLLALEIAGLRGARLYAGSWSDWCSYVENPVETGP